MSDKLRVFVASSSEQIKVAERIAEALKDPREWNVRVWNELFSFSATYIESLEQELERADFAVVVLTADDAGSVRDRAVNLPRDNVIFELGLFIGRLGRPRCFFFIDGDSDTKIASDLSGVKLVNFYPDTDAMDPRKPSLKTQAKQVKAQMRALPARYKPSQEVRKGQEALWRFSSRVAGHWWERIRKGEDDKSALSYLTVAIDEVTNTPRLHGRVYGQSGESLADWDTITAGVLLGEMPTVYYRWEGEHEISRGQKYGGGGVIYFDDDRIETGYGHFYDTNFALIEKGALTRVKNFGLYRCEASEIEIMKQPFSDDAKALITERLETLRGR